MRRHVAVTAAVLAGLAGEWLGHGLAYYRLAGLAGLGSGLGGIHAYMVPTGLALVLIATGGAAVWLAAWQELGRRLDSSGAALRRLLRSGRPDPTPVAASPTLGARYLALALPMAALQCGLFLLQENVERVAAGGSAAGIGPLLGDHGAAALIQAAVAAVMAAVVLVAVRLLGRRAARVDAVERVIAILCHTRLRRIAPSATAKLRLDVCPARLILGNALWNRPPPAVAV
jgi:hypothetical protein